jgi:hypothetical protein
MGSELIQIGDQTGWKEELRYEYDLKETDYVLDIGSYRMEFANEIIKRFGCKVECFDALDGKAAWIEDGMIMMGGAYLYTSMYNEDKQEVKCVDIAPYLKDVALCKINIEGGEYLLLQYILSKGLQANVRNFQVQFHMVENLEWQKWYDDITKELSKTHKLTWRFPFVWENWERC